MKSGGTDMAHKAEHAVDMSGEGAVIVVTLHGGAKGDTKSLPDTLEKAQSNLQELANNAEYCERIHEDAGREVVGDKGYHGNDILVELVEQEYRSYISEPERGGRKWKDKQAEQAATYANRRRIRGTRGKRLISRQEGHIVWLQRALSAGIPGRAAAPSRTCARWSAKTRNISMGSQAFGHDKPGELVGFARVLSDKVFKALIFDVFVDPAHRGRALGRHTDGAHPERPTSDRA